MFEPTAFLEWATGAGAWSVYLLLGIGAALENVVPPIPADTFVVLGGVLAGRGLLEPAWVMAATLIGNLVSALAVYSLGRRYGEAFFRGRIGSWVLSPDQVLRVGTFFRRYGVPSLVVARMLPGVRAVVPAFAGLSGVGVRVVAGVLTATAVVWYGVLVWLGYEAGGHLEQVLATLERAHRALLVLTVIFVIGIALWWSRTRKRRSERGEP